MAIDDSAFTRGHEGSWRVLFSCAFDGDPHACFAVAAVAVEGDEDGGGGDDDGDRQRRVGHSMTTPKAAIVSHGGTGAPGCSSGADQPNTWVACQRKPSRVASSASQRTVMPFPSVA